MTTRSNARARRQPVAAKMVRRSDARPISLVTRRGRAIQERMDGGWINPISGQGTRRDRRIYSVIGNDYVPDIEAAALWRFDWLIRRIIELAPRDGTRPGFNIKIASGTGSGKEKAEGLLKECERLSVVDKLAKTGMWRRAYGGGAMFPVLQGAVGDLSEPLDPYFDGITKVSAIHLLEPRELRPYTWYRDINNPKFRRPEIYQLWPLSGNGGTNMTATLIHESRLGIMNGAMISNQVQPGQRPGWGDGEIAHVRQVAADFGSNWAAVSTILQNFAKGVLKLKNMSDLLGSEGGREVVSRKIQAIDEVSQILGTMVVDSDDDYSRQSTSVSGMEGLLAQAAQIVAATAGMPASRLLGLSPAGFSDGDNEVRSWYDCCDIERQGYNEVLLWLIKLLMLQGDGPCKGIEPDVWSAPWNPLWQPSDKEIAETRFIDSQADKNWFSIGACSADDIATSHWAGDTYSRDIQIDWKAREEQAQLMATDPGATETDEDGNPLPPKPPGKGGVNVDRTEGDKPDGETADENADGDATTKTSAKPGVPAKAAAKAK